LPGKDFRFLGVRRKKKAPIPLARRWRGEGDPQGEKNKGEKILLVPPEGRHPVNKEVGPDQKNTSSERLEQINSRVRKQSVTREKTPDHV